MSDFSPRLLGGFAATVSAELGRENFLAVLEKASLPLEWADAAALARPDPAAAGEVYAGLQKGLRTYYGRGARGILLRVGGKFWKRLLDDSPLALKPQIALTRGLPPGARRKATLDLLARLLSTRAAEVTVHTLDLDLLLVDHASPAAMGQSETEPICWVTVGLIRESLYWANHREFDVTEISCRALGAQACEFKIQTGA